VYVSHFDRARSTAQAFCALTGSGREWRLHYRADLARGSAALSPQRTGPAPGEARADHSRC